MAIHFNRRESQESCESIARSEQGLAYDADNFVFNGLTLNTNHVTQLLPCCYKDAVGFYYNALVSFALGLHSISKKDYSWASVQLYYSVYYSCRAVLGFDKYILIRKGDLFKLKIKDAERTQKSSSRNDHKATIDFYKSIYGQTDYLLSNNIDNVDFYTWIATIREITHYKQNHFKEPDHLNIFDIIVSDLKSGKMIGELLEKFSTNWNLYCFQEEYAAITGPYHLLIDVHQKYTQQAERISIQQRKYIEKIFKNIKCGEIVQSLL